jgi:dipeptidyl aminopeptidase/acylaminoacyl peptidase
LAQSYGVLACTPHPGLGTVAVSRPAIVQNVDLATCRTATRTAPAHGFTSRDGSFTATVRRTGKLRTLRDTIWITDRRTGTARAIYSVALWGDTSGLASPGPIELLAWSGDDRWIFFAIDPGGSGSIAADGLILRVVSIAGGRPHRLPVMLPWANYLAWCGGRLVFTAGNDREAAHHKQLDVAGPPSWQAKPLVRTPTRAYGALTCSPDRRSVIVQSQRDRNDANFFGTRWQLWRVGLDGSTTLLTSPPPRHADESPRFSPDGKTLYFVRSSDGNGKLYALRNGKVIGPLLSLGHLDGYYGHQDWPYTIRR